MLAWHYFYFISMVVVIAAILYPIVVLKRWVTFAVIFPAFFLIYSFLGPLPIIFGRQFEAYSRSFLVWNEMYQFTDDTPFISAHCLLLLFLLFWYVGFHLGGGFRCHATASLPPQREATEAGYLQRGWIVLAQFALLAATTYCVIGPLRNAWADGLSFYAAKGTRDPHYAFAGSYVKGLITLWEMSTLVWLGCYLCSTRGNLLSRVRTAEGATILGCLAYLTFLCAAIGERSQLLVTIIGAPIVYHLLGNPIKLNYKLIMGVFSAMIFMAVIKRTRGMDLADSSGLAGVNVFYVLVSTLMSVESFAPYAAVPVLLDVGAEPVYGTSILYLAVSLIPRFLAPWRPTSNFSYEHYAQFLVYREDGRGYCMHHVADWYLNFGVFGIVLGGLVVGWLLAQLEHRALSRRSQINLFWIVVFAAVCGYMPTLLRVGIEGYRSVVYEIIALPFVLLVLFRGRQAVPEKVEHPNHTSNNLGCVH